MWNFHPFRWTYDGSKRLAVTGGISTGPFPKDFGSCWQLCSYTPHHKLMIHAHHLPLGWTITNHEINQQQCINMTRQCLVLRQTGSKNLTKIRPLLLEQQRNIQNETKTQSPWRRQSQETANITSLTFKALLVLLTYTYLKYSISCSTNVYSALVFGKHAAHKLAFFTALHTVTLPLKLLHYRGFATCILLLLLLLSFSMVQRQCR